MAAAIIYVLDRDERIREIPEIYNAIHTESLNGGSVLEFVSTRRIEKYEHIVFQDLDGTWHEFIVSGVDEQHASDGVEYFIYCESVLTELINDWVRDERIDDFPPYIALQKALTNTRWSISGAEVAKTGSVKFHRESAYSALSKIVEEYGGEIQTIITVTDGKITDRSISLLNQRGSDNGARFEWNRNAAEIKREVKRGDVITALHGYGKGLEFGADQRLSFETKNKWLDYVTNESARRIYGRVSNARSWEILADSVVTWQALENLGCTWQQAHDMLGPGRTHRHGAVLFDDIEDPAELLAATIEKLEKLSQPAVSYSARVTDFTALGMPRVQLGDVISVIDDDLGIEKKIRVVQIKRDILDSSLDEIILGEKTGSIAGAIAAQQKAISSMRSTIGATQMTSLDGLSWIDYAVPEIRINGQTNGNLKISASDVLRVENSGGEFAGGFSASFGKLIAGILSNSKHGTDGITRVFNDDDHHGVEFIWGDNKFFLSLDQNKNMYLHINGKPRQSWSADGSTFIRDEKNQVRISARADGRSALMSSQNNHEIGVDNAGPYYIRSGLKTYF